MPYAKILNNGGTFSHCWIWINLGWKRITQRHVEETIFNLLLPASNMWLTYTCLPCDDSRTPAGLLSWFLPANKPWHRPKPDWSQDKEKGRSDANQSSGLLKGFAASTDHHCEWLAAKPEQHKRFMEHSNIKESQGCARNAVISGRAKAVHGEPSRQALTTLSPIELMALWQHKLQFLLYRMQNIWRKPRKITRQTIFMYVHYLNILCIFLSVFYDFIPVIKPKLSLVAAQGSVGITLL